MSLFGYFNIGLRSMNAAQVGLRVAGDNIANAFTPGYARRRVELGQGYPLPIAGSFLGQGVQVDAVRRAENSFLQTGMEREIGTQAGSEERLRGLQQIETIYGPIASEGGIGAALAGFTTAFDTLTGQPEDMSLRRGAVAAAARLAGAMRGNYQRLEEQRRLEDGAVGSAVERINALAEELAKLNREIEQAEASGGVAASLRDRRGMVTEELADLTGGSAVTASGNRVQFALPGGPTLVTGDEALPLGTSRASDGTLRILSGADGTDVTDRVRRGRLGSLLAVRDEDIPGQLESLDRLAADLITRANSLTTSAFDLQGNPGTALFEPDPPTTPGAAGRMSVASSLLQDPALLAVSADGSPGDGTVAAQLGGLIAQSSAGLGGLSANDYFAEMMTKLGTEMAEVDVSESVSRAVLDSLVEQREAVSGVSLDEATTALLTKADAQDELTALRAAIDEISARRGGLGSALNRLEATVNVVSVQAQNLQAAESQIRDADIAGEIVTMTKFQVLNQTGLSALAQANVSSQSVLSLLS